MTEFDKIHQLSVDVSPDDIDIELATSLLSKAKYIILNRMYPFGYRDDMEVPACYEQLQIMIAVELYSKRGAEGQKAHTENSIQRTYENGSGISNSLLKQIIPHVGGVIKNEVVEQE